MFYTRFEIDTVEPNIKYVLILGVPTIDKVLSEKDKAKILWKQLKLIELELRKNAVPTAKFSKELAKMGCYRINEAYIKYAKNTRKTTKKPALKKDRFGLISVNNYNVGNYIIYNNEAIVMVVAKR